MYIVATNNTSNNTQSYTKRSTELHLIAASIREHMHPVVVLPMLLSEIFERLHHVFEAMMIESCILLLHIS